MREIINASHNFSKRDTINSRSGYPLQEFDGSTMEIPEVVACAMMKDTDEDTGEIKNISVIKTKDSHYFTSISETVYDTMDAVIEILDEEGSVSLRVDKRQSKSKRDFLTLLVL